MVEGWGNYWASSLLSLPRPTPSGLPDVLSLGFGIGGGGIINTRTAGTALGALEASVGQSHRFACPPTPHPPHHQARESATEDNKTQSGHRNGENETIKHTGGVQPNAGKDPDNETPK